MRSSKKRGRSSKNSRSSNLNLRIFELIKQGYPISHKNKEGQEKDSICYFLDMKKNAVQYYVSSLKKQGYIEKVGYGTWRAITDKKPKSSKKKQRSSKNSSQSSRGMKAEKPPTNLHALEIKFPILDGEIKDKDWKIKNKLKNWLPKYKKLKALDGLTIRNNNQKSITVFAESRDIKDLNEVDNLAFKIRTYIYEYFKNKEKVYLDVFNCQTKNLNLATEDKNGEEMIRKGEKFELDLNKKAEKTFEKDERKAKAWIDGSPYDFTAETNDKEWKREYLGMPFRVAHLSNSLPALEEYNKNLKLHLDVQKQTLETQKKMQKTIEELKKEIKRLKNE